MLDLRLFFSLLRSVCASHRDRFHSLPTFHSWEVATHLEPLQLNCTEYIAVSQWLIGCLDKCLHCHGRSPHHSLSCEPVETTKYSLANLDYSIFSNVRAVQIPGTSFYFSWYTDRRCLFSKQWVYSVG